MVAQTLLQGLLQCLSWFGGTCFLCWCQQTSESMLRRSDRSVMHVERVMCTNGELVFTLGGAIMQSFMDSCLHSCRYCTRAMLINTVACAFSPVPC